MFTKALEALSNLYWPLLPEAIIGDFLRNRSRGDSSLLEDAVNSVTGANTNTFFVPLDGRWDGRSIQKLLKNNGIPMGSWSTYDGQLFFHVHRDDAPRAHQIMQSAGVDLL